MKDGNTATAMQAAPRAQPSPFDKLMWVGELQSRRDLTASARRIVVRLAYHHNSTTGRCDPSIKALAEGAGISKRMVNTALDELREAGIIEWIPGNEKTRNKYTLRDVPLWDYQTKTGSMPNPAKRPASSSGATVIPFPGQAETSQPDTGGSEPQFTRVVNSGSHEPLKSNPSRGYDEEKGEEESQPSKASDSPASPLCLDGDGPSMAGKDEKQPEKQPEAETKPADGRMSFAEVATPEWIKKQLDGAASSEAYQSGSGRTPNDPSVADELLKKFRELTTRAGIREAEGRWNDMWVSFYQQKRPKAPSMTKRKGESWI